MLFLDDDVEPAPGLVAAHAARHGGPYAAVCGQVLQPGEFPDPEANRGPRRTGFLADLDFRFNGTKPAEIRNVMAGNLSVARETALAIGGFDEQFIGSAPVIVAAGALNLDDKVEAAATLTAEELAVARNMGLSPETFAKAKEA